MADKGFNQSTFTFGTSLTPLRSIDYGSDGARVKVSGSADAQKFYVDGIPDNTVTVTLVGNTALDAGDTNATCTIAFYDGTSITFGQALITDVEISGSEDTEIISTVQFVPGAT
jgi:hypothetical protein